MDTSLIIEQAKKIVDEFRRCGDSYVRYEGAFAKAKEFIRVYAGPKSEFYSGLSRADAQGYVENRAGAAAEVVDAFVNYIESGLLTGLSPERRARIDVVSDFLEQAVHLLEDQNVHAAVPAPFGDTLPPNRDLRRVRCATRRAPKLKRSTLGSRWFGQSGVVSVPPTCH